MTKGVFVKGMSKPECCIMCPFLSRLEEMPNTETDSDNNFVYHKIAHCHLRPDDIEDPWRGEKWLLHHTEEWCPIKEMENE